MVIDAIIRGPRAWTSAGVLAKRYGARAIKECQRDGLITCWTHDRAGKRLRGPAWTLTERGAHVHGVNIAEVPNATGMGTPFWASGQDEEGRPRRAVRMATPSRIHERKGPVKGQVVVDEEGRPLVVLGAHARIDPRLGTKRKVGKNGR